MNCLEILIINQNMALDSNTALVIETFFVVIQCMNYSCGFGPVKMCNNSKQMFFNILNTFAVSNLSLCIIIVMLGLIN